MPYLCAIALWNLAIYWLGSHKNNNLFTLAKKYLILCVLKLNHLSFISILMSSNKFFLLILILYTTNNPSQAQKHDYFLPFGYANGSMFSEFGGATMNFNFSPPKIYKEKKEINFNAFCASCSDSSGNWLFYSNGISIQHKMHNLMQNGDSINYGNGEIWNEYKTDGYPNSAGGEVVPYPGHPNQYIMVHQATTIDYVNDLILGSPFYATTIDMDANNGLGRVVSKNQILREGNLTDFVVTKHGNGRDWWVIIAEVSMPRHYIYLIDSDGVHPAMVQDYGPSFPSTEAVFFSSISPDGTTYVRMDYTNGIRVYDFNRCTGTLSNLRILPFYGVFSENTATTNVEFSPDSRYMYVNSFTVVMRLDMWAPEPYNTLDTVAINDGFATPLPLTTEFWRSRLGPDDKIYYSTGNSTTAIHVMHHPELPGLAADFEQHGVTPPVYYFSGICGGPNYRLGTWLGSSCDTIQLQPNPPEGFKHTVYEPDRWNNPNTTTYTIWPTMGKPGKQTDGSGMGQTEYDLFMAREKKRKSIPVQLTKKSNEE